MDKIICDVCGTSYPDSASQCPICGYVRTQKTKSATDANVGYQPVRGGRFSSGNVKRKSSGQPVRRQSSSPQKKSVFRSSNLIFGLVAIALLAAIIFIVVMVFSSFLSGDNKPSGTSGSGNVSQTDPDDNVLRLCQELHTGAPVIELASEGASVGIEAYPIPADTTDTISYVSMNPAIATVSDDGTVTAVASGNTAITVCCGNATLIITVKCTFAPPVPDGGSWSMNRKDITLSKKGETWDLYSKNSTIPKNLIVWTSDDETVATIDGGVVQAVGSGKTTVHGECNGVKYSCTIRCNLPKDDKTEVENKPEDTKPTEPDDTQPTEPSKTAKISHTDVTLRHDGGANEKSFNLYLRDANGNKLDVTWVASEEGYVTIEGNLITAVKGGKSITVSTTYEGTTYKCTIRLK